MRMRRFSFGLLAACGALLVTVMVMPSAQAQQPPDCVPSQGSGPPPPRSGGPERPAYPPARCEEVQADRQANAQVGGETLERQPPRAGGESATRANRAANQRGGGNLPRTGSSSTVTLVSTAIGLVLAGSALVVLRRRRAESSTP